MGKLRVLIARMKTASFKRMMRYAKLASRESGRWVPFILIDMVICAFRYGVGYLDYHTFGFAHLRSHKIRSTYMTMNDNIALINKINNQERRETFENKYLFDRAFGTRIGRDFIGLQGCTEEEFCSFVEGKDRIFVKTLDGYGGLGVSAIDVPELRDKQAELLGILQSAGYGLAEEAIRQHPEMNKLCAKSVNTLRMVTVTDSKGKPSLVYALVRMGMGTAAVDNISSGGMYSPLSMDGVITAPAFCDKTGELYTVHPVNGTRIVGFQIPEFEKAKELVLDAATVIPDVRYVGWDVAISENGPVLVEGNTIPSYDMCQNYRHLPEGEKHGILPRFHEIFGEEF